MSQILVQLVKEEEFRKSEKTLILILEKVKWLAMNEKAKVVKYFELITEKTYRDTDPAFCVAALQCNVVECEVKTQLFSPDTSSTQLAIFIILGVVVSTLRFADYTVWYRHAI